ncbi:siphovirus Gp157 family protein [Clostridium felsineum]|uniref:siphovirus Gp157 family protein n=1 Tax=Clostridium felsineum TaxID=36839 RepID=UPI00214D8EDA|nr:siphovirus Gp157 family protein [Clostridium felsineum]MCR3759199.1 siphovirus Gp157 family protein [Clostridium felsineum]
MQLYKLAENYKNLLELLEDETIPQDIIQKSLAEVGGNIEDKAENIAKLIKSLDADAKALKEESKRLSDRQHAMENRSKSLRKYLEDNLKILNKDKVKTKLFTIAMQKNAPVMKVLDKDKIPENYFIVTKEIQRTEILKALKKGEKVPGAKLQQSESLRIR